MDIKYQVFISSTFVDLEDERKAIIQAILELYHIPIGMEMFSAEDEEQWEIIRRTISVSDYYILIIGLRYGSKTSEGISYTEKEYDYALEQKIPILAFMLEEDVPLSPKQRDDDLTEINRFRQKVKTNSKMLDFWGNKDQLSMKVAIALPKQIAQKPRIGWVRGDQVQDNTHLTNELTKLSNENRELRAQVEQFKQDEVRIIINLDEDYSIDLNSFHEPDIEIFQDLVNHHFPLKKVSPVDKSSQRKVLHARYNSGLLGQSTTTEYKGITEQEIDTYEREYQVWLEETKESYLSLKNRNVAEIFDYTFSIENVGNIPADNLKIEIYAEEPLIFAPYINDADLDLIREGKLARKDTDGYMNILLGHDIENKLFLLPPTAPVSSRIVQNQGYGAFTPMREFSAPYIPSLFNRSTLNRNAFYYKDGDRPKKPTNSISLECISFTHKVQEYFQLSILIPSDYKKSEFKFTINIRADNIKDVITQDCVIKINTTSTLDALEFYKDLFNLS